jgi:Family of unknown function (DUF5678)
MCMINPNTKWIALHFKEISKKFAGKYVAIVNERVIASGATSTEVIKIAHEKEPNKQPILMKVPTIGISI